MLAVPPEKPPPWIHTMTGSGRRGSVLGVYTLTTRQSSAVLVLVTPVPTLPVCAHTLPKVVVSLMPVHGAAGRGGRQRSAPTGGAAYGMPRNSRASAVKKPCTAPLSVRTTRGAEPVWECPAATAVPVAMPVSPTARPAAAASRLMDRLGAMACFISRHRELRPAAGCWPRGPVLRDWLPGRIAIGYSPVVFSALARRSRQAPPCVGARTTS